MSLHSSLGNHTIAEAAALVYAGILFPEMPRAEERRALGLQLLETEAVHQIVADGGGAEQGFWYLRFISDLYGLVAGLLSSQGHSVPERIQRALKQSRSFLGAMTDSAGRIPTIGDSDNGYALSPLLSPSPEAQEKTPLITFFASGYSVLRSQGSPGTSLIFDHGPLGMGPCYAHGHADALSVLCRVDDEEFLVDPGTFAYSGHPEWRRYFRGTRAHNTVVIDDLDQAVQETAFQWSSPYSVRLLIRKELTGGETVLIAVHDGYQQRSGVLHYRGILGGKSGLWVIVDLLSGPGYHTLELNWHLGSAPVPNGAGYVLTGKRAQLYLTVDGGHSQVLRGHEDPAGGWYSPVYGHREPLDTLQVTYQGSLPHEFVTCFAVESHDDLEQQSAVSLLKDLIDEARTH